MGVLSKLNNLFRPARLTRGRMAFALIVAVGADALQFALGPLGWFGAVQVIDVIAMILTTLTIGFHVLLLPTFVIEFIPLLDMMPTWTGCVVAVIALRRRGETQSWSTVETPPAAPAPPPMLQAVNPPAAPKSPPPPPPSAVQ